MTCVFTINRKPLGSPFINKPELGNRREIMTAIRFVWVDYKQVKFDSFDEFKKWVKDGFAKFQAAPVMRTTRKGEKGMKRQMAQTLSNATLSTVFRSLGLQVSGFCPQCPNEEQLQAAFSKLEISEGN